MDKIISFLTGKYILLLLLAIPGVLGTFNYINGQLDYNMMMRITGEFAGRFLPLVWSLLP